MKHLIIVLTFFMVLRMSGQATPAPVVVDNKNWSSSITYNFSGVPIAKSVSFFNDLGKAQQQQNWDVLTNRVWATELRYDFFNRPAIETLSAPINGMGTFGYRPDFIQSSSSSVSIDQYDSSTTLFTPPQISDVVNSLGWYYSSQNVLDRYQDITSYPYSRVVYSTLNPGTTRAILGGNKINGEWLQSYSFTMANDTGSNIVGPYSTKILKTVTRGVDGIESVVYNDTDGNLLGAARSGDAPSRSSSSKILDKGFVDIHIPVGCGGSVSLMNFDAVNHRVRVFDLITEALLYNNVTTSISLSPGFYRFEDVNNYYGKNNSDLTPITPVTVNYLVNYYDYALNRYDYADRLVSSKQPLGIGSTAPLESTYSYNTLGQLISATSPDEGASSFVYRKDGQIRFSQNSEQAKVHAFSYTNYDNLGRPVESGIYNGVAQAFAGASYFADVTDSFPQEDRIEQNFSVYDLPDPELSAKLEECKLPSKEYIQTYVAGNVSYTYTQNPFTTKTWYSYDIYGRVKWMIQQIPGLSCLKTIDYTYNPVDGQLTRVEYQKYSSPERFIHKYQYNLAGQLTNVSTSTNNTSFTQQAHYIYNESGALVRTELATNLQGIDYVYNLNGQLKAINHPSIIPANDPGGDGVSSSFAGDTFGMAIDYYNGDYTRGNTPKPVTTSPQGTDQYNGNIKATRWNTQVANNTQNAYTYKYNKNNWLTEATFGLADASAVITNNVNNDYRVSDITYDANGNILTLNRKGYTDGNGNNNMDVLTYRYGSTPSNRLLSVKDSGDNTDPNRYNDIKDQNITIPTGAPPAGGLTPTVSLDNYLYNDLGQLTANYQDKIFYEYNASGLVSKIKSFTSDNIEEYKTLYYNDYTNFTDSHGWVQDNSANINASSHTPFELANETNSFMDCYLEDGSGNVLIGGSTAMLQINGKTKIIRKFRVTQNSTFRLNFDLMLYNYIESGVPEFTDPDPNNPNTGTSDGNGVILPNSNPDYFAPTTIVPSVVVKLKKPDGTSVIYNTTITGGVGQTPNYCDLYFPVHIDTGDFTTTTEEYVTLELTIGNNLPTTGTTTVVNLNNRKSAKQKTYLDNLKLEAATNTKVAFYYNDRGQRVEKDDIFNSTSRTSTYYVRDAAGNCISVYRVITGDELQFGGQTLTEQSIFGAGRIGVYKRSPDKYGTYFLYELTDNLGNVRAVIRKTSAGALALTGKTDYYPFGMPMPNQQFTDQNYRYAFQGQEKDPETGMEAFELRLWDGRIGRWLTVDPYGQYYSPYLGMGNNPVSMVDPDGGACGDPPTDHSCRNGETWNDGVNSWTMEDGAWMNSNMTGGVNCLLEVTIRQQNSNTSSSFWSDFDNMMRHNRTMENLDKYFESCGKSVPDFLNMNWLTARASGFLFNDGQLKDGFTGGEVGPKGTLYDYPLQTPWAPGPELYNMPNSTIRTVRSLADHWATECDAGMALNEIRNADDFEGKRDSASIAYMIYLKKDYQVLAYGKKKRDSLLPLSTGKYYMIRKR